MFYNSVFKGLNSILLHSEASAQADLFYWSAPSLMLLKHFINFLSYYQQEKDMINFWTHWNNPKNLAVTNFAKQMSWAVPHTDNLNVLRNIMWTRYPNFSPPESRPVITITTFNIIVSILSDDRYDHFLKAYTVLRTWREGEEIGKCLKEHYLFYSQIDHPRNHNNFDNTLIATSL